MFCNQCGYQVSENSKFCKRCGNRIAQAERKCPGCGASYEEDAVYCEECGTRLPEPGSKPEFKRVEVTEVKDTRPAVVIKPAPAPAPSKPARTGKLFKSVLVSWYNGEVKFGMAKTAGLLYAYDDHISYGGKVSSSLLTMYRGGEGISIPLDDISDVKDSRFGGMFPSMVITLKNGQKHTFAASIGGGAIPEIVQFLKDHI